MDDKLRELIIEIRDSAKRKVCDEIMQICDDMKRGGFKHINLEILEDSIYLIRERK